VQFCQEAAKSRKLISKKPVKLTRAKNSLNFQVNLRGLTHDVLDWTQHSSNLSTLGIFLQDQLLSAVHATGLAILTDRDRVHFGQTPPDNALSDLQYWLPSSHLARSTFSTHALATEYPDVAAYCNNAAGLLVIPLDETGTQVALWFRTEVVRSIEWAGIDHKTLIDDDLGPRLEPRSSFARWVQTRRGESEPWTALQVDAAHTLSMTLSWILARQRLRQSELRYRSLIDWSPDAIVVHQQGNIVYVNPAAVKMFGATSERELLGSPVVDHVHPDHRNTVFARLQRNQTDNIDTPLLDEKFIKLNGSTMDVELKSMSITFDAEPACQLAMRDVTERKIIEDQLRVSAHALKSISQGVLITSVDKRIVSVNDAFMRITGYSRAEVMGCDRDVLLGPLTDTNTVEAMNLALLQETVFHGEILNYCKDGRPFWNESTISPLRNQMGQLTHFVSIVRDITLRKITEKKIKLAASVFTHAREGIFIAEADSTIIDVNDTFTHITGYAREEVLGKKPNLLQSGRHTSEFYAAMWRDLNKKGHWQGEIWNKKKNGVIYPEILSISAVLDADGVIQHYVGLFTDISVIKGHESQLEKMAHFDPLTGLPNRALLGDRLRQAMVLAQRRAQQLAVVTLDLDGFKSINDAYGHEVGDHLLVIVANRIMQSLRDGDTLARLGGDEFVAIFNNLPDLSACESMLNRLLLAAAEPVQVGEHLLQVSASLGVAFFPQSQTVDADVLIRQANQVMYQAKQAGKNLYRIFDADYDRSVRNHHESIKRLTQALQNEEFVLYYQPKVNMRSGCVIGAEALIRWQHPEKGLLPPAAFLPEMEDNPLAIQVGEWVINTALTQIEQWQAQGLQLAVSVNVGVMQLQQADFVDRLRALLTAHPKVKPSSLEMEVLETSALEDVIRVTHVIKMCQSMGVKFALDDFGTGYSSLTYLKRLPVSMLKIDQSFVRGMLDDSDDLSILEGILGMAQAFRRDVIAEGVETVAHGAMLLQLGCDLAQGYGIARPMPADKLQDWVLNWRVDSSWCNLQVLSRSDLPLLYAAADHRAWVLLLEKYLRDNSSELPLLNPFECRFGRWLEGEGRPQHAHKLSFVLVVHLHQKVHALGSAICFHHDKGQRSQAQALMPEIYKLRDALLVELMTLVRQ
jgi:diguanylate cyclase (GGDEF)-like protein/PAS domain S-box-containing protein